MLIRDERAILLAPVLLVFAGCGDSSPTGPVGDGPLTETNSPPHTQSGAVAYANLPSDFSTLTETSFSAAREGGFSSSTNRNFAIVEDASAPRSASKVARATFPAGLSDGVSPIWSEAAIAKHSARRLYLSFWIKVSDDWQAHATGVNKVAIAWTHREPVVVTNIQGSGAGRLGSEIRVQDTPDGPRNLTPNRADPEIVRGRWHQWEVILVANTGDSADGEVHWWVDGTKAGAFTDVRFGSASQAKVWDHVTWRPVWGGRGDTVRRTMHMWMDHYYVAGAP